MKDTNNDVQKAAEESGNNYMNTELAPYNSRVKENGRKDFIAGFIAGTQWKGEEVADQLKGENEAIAQADYWKKRCEAAEMLIGKDVINRNDYDKEYELWQSLKSK